MKVKDQKQLIIEITPELHSEIKAKAAFLRTSIKNYVLSAIEEKIAQDKTLNK